MKNPCYSISLTQFRQLTRRGNLVPVYREILADQETPVSAFSKINSGHTAFLFESIEGGEHWARYSFLGSSATQILWEENGQLYVRKGRKTETHPLTHDPLTLLRALIEEFQPVRVPDLPALCRGSRWLSGI